MLPTTVIDELGDTIVFDGRGVPVHAAGGHEVELGALGSNGTACPVLHKFTHRLSDPKDNAIRWRFEVVGQRGTGIDFEAGMYRLRPRASSLDEFGMDTGAWLTNWQPAQVLDTVEGGVRYEVVLLRSQIPWLTTVRGEIEIELRGANQLGVATIPVRYCWEHVPLAPPLQVRNVVEAVGAGSLHEINLDPGNNLGPLLDGVPLEQGAAVMDLEIVNGTAEPVFARLAIEQGLATYSKSWQKTNVFLAVTGASDCLGAGECMLDFPSDRQTVMAAGETGTMDGLLSGIVVQDMTTGQHILPCTGCEPDTYLFEPRIMLGEPRVYRVRLVVTDLSVLVPQLADVNLGPFAEVLLDAEMLPTPVTGRTFGRVRICMGTFPDSLQCGLDNTYQHYVALTEATLSLPGVHLSAMTSTSSELPLIKPPAHPGVLGAPVGIETYQWSTTEEPLSLYPEPAR